MSEPEGSEYISEALLLSRLPSVKDEKGQEKDVGAQLAFLRGQVEMAGVFRERDDLRTKVTTLSTQNMELHGRLKAQEVLLRERLEREVGERFRLLEEDIDRAYADGMRELDQEMYPKRARMEAHDSDDLQRVLRNCVERMRLVLRTGRPH